MDECKIKLEVFEGPMALLMHLIEKNEIDINDIPIAKVTEQYLSYIKALEEFNIDIASEFLLMAATLLQIKSRLLLPRPTKVSDSEPDEEDPRRELVDRLLEYRRFKQIAAVLESMHSVRQRYFARLPQEFENKVHLPEGLSVQDLVKALSALLASEDINAAIVNPEAFSVKDKMRDIINILGRCSGRAELRETLSHYNSRSELIASFLAVLELLKLRKIDIEQRQVFGPIYLILREE